MNRIIVITSFLLISYFNAFAYEDIKPSNLKQLVDGKRSEIFNDDENFNYKFTNHLVSEIVFDDKYRSNNNDEEFKDVTSSTRLYSYLNFAKNFSLNSQINLQKVPDKSQNNGDNKIFEDEALLLRELNLLYDNKKHAFFIGKFDLNFGKAWNWNGGIFSNQIAQNYQKSEKIGFGQFFRTGESDKNGKYQFGYSFFKNDQKYFDNSLITKRNSSSKSNAIAGDDNMLNSYIVSLDVDFDFSELEKLYYHFAYVNSSINKNYSEVSGGKKADQEDFVASINYVYPINNDFVIDGLLEYVEVRNYLGNKDNSEKYFTALLDSYFYQNYSLTLVHAKRQNFTIGENGFDEVVNEISIGYKFNKNKFFDKLHFQIGYKNEKEDLKTSSTSTNSLIALVRYQKIF